MSVGGDIVFDDLRFENEAEWVRDMGGIVVCLYRGGKEFTADHASEAGYATPDLLIKDYGSPEEGAMIILEHIHEQMATQGPEKAEQTE